MHKRLYMLLGLSNPLARTQPVAWSNYSGSRKWVPSSKTWCWRVSFESHPSKPVKLDLLENIRYLRFLSFPTIFHLDLANFGDQNNQIRHKYTRFDDSWHDLGGKSSDLMKSLPNSTRSHWILDKLGEISSIFAFFRWFLVGFGFTWNRCPPDGKSTRET